MTQSAMNLAQLTQYSQQCVDYLKSLKSQGADNETIGKYDAKARVAFADLEAFRESVRQGVLQETDTVNVSIVTPSYDEYENIIKRGYISPISYAQLAPLYVTNTIRTNESGVPIGEPFKVAPTISQGLPRTWGSSANSSSSKLFLFVGIGVAIYFLMRRKRA